jgi:nitrogen fixation-related uncharacterized protein
MSGPFESAMVLVFLSQLAVMLAAVIAGVVWAARAGQFRDQDRARYLPLVSPPPDDSTDDEAARGTTDGGSG